MNEHYDIFISYSRKDLERVKTIKAELEQATNARCWMDLQGVESGVPRFTTAIIDGIRACDVFLFMRSETSQTSEFALRELNYASKRHKKVVIVNVDSSQMCDEFEFLYGLTDTIAWNDQPQREKLIRDINQWTGSVTQTPTKDDVVCKKHSPHLLRFIKQYRYRILVSVIVLAVVLFVVLSGVFSLRHSADTNDSPKETDVESLVETGNIYYSNKEYEKAFSCYKEAAEQGDEKSQYILGEMYYFGYGVDSDFNKAIIWYRKAAEQGHVDAQVNLGWMYLNGYGVAKNDSAAFNWYHRAAVKGLPKAQANLGVMYEKGWGVTKNNSQALMWFRKAAEQGYADAQYSIGYMFEVGKGVVQNDVEAVKWYQKAAEQGQVNAQYNLGLMYYQGRGVSQCDSLAVKWLRLAADQEHANALKTLDMLLNNKK